MNGQSETQIYGMPTSGSNSFMGAEGLLFGLIFGGLLGNRGGLLGGGSAGVSEYQMGVNAGQNFTKSDGFAMQNAVQETVNQGNVYLGTQIGNGFDVVNGGIRNAIDVSLQGFNSVNTNIKDAQYANALQFQNLESTNAMQTVTLTNAIREEGQATRELINSNTIQALRDSNERLQTQYDFASRGLLEASGPFLSTFAPSPCANQTPAVDLNSFNLGVNVGSGTQTQVPVNGIIAGK